MLGPAPVLRTPRLLLRPLGPGDAAAMFAYAGEPGFFQYVHDVPAEVRDRYEPRHAEAHLRELLELAARGYPNWGIVPEGADQPVGAIRFKPALEDGGPELGYGLASAWRGQGLASEAAVAVVQWALPHAHGPLVARADPRNLASHAVLRHAGFRPAGADGRGSLLFKLAAGAAR
ncbi:MAG: [ribosomal protein S5]-alanine N-acetyltransferase [Thermoplasmata archaeon]|jgi:RimJ/RimL family protein N-acetyltransferase|nr:[ribosomal protein S5]-alanine N-acetyltransferase [Thermoplasmata archaeon]